MPIQGDVQDKSTELFRLVAYLMNCTVSQHPMSLNSAGSDEKSN